MRYSAEHRELTRERILEAAARRFRQDGIDGVAIATLMADAGLTHGGFYWHFKSKDELLSASVEHAAEKTFQKLEASSEAAEDSSKSLTAMLRYYLSERHRDSPADGCVAAALAGEIARQDSQVRDEFTRALKARVDLLKQHMGGGRGSREKALATIAMMIGALTLSRAVNDEALSSALLAAGRKYAPHND